MFFILFGEPRAALRALWAPFWSHFHHFNNSGTILNHFKPFLNENLAPLAISGKSVRWYGKFWEQISDQINKANLTDQEGEKISASVDYNQLTIQSKSQSNLEVQATAYNDQGGYNTQPRFTQNQRILTPKAQCPIGYNF